MTHYAECPVAAALEINKINLTREIRRLKGNLKICKSCETANGQCQQMHSIRDQIQDALNTVLGEMDLAEVPGGA